MLTGFMGATIHLARQTNNLGKLVQPGTSAVEQYTPRGNQGPWTDVYACAATICQAVTGQEVPAATKRLDDKDPLEALLQDADAFSSPAVRDTLAHALTVDPSKRLQSIEALRKALINASEKYDGTTTAYTITPAAKPEAKAEDDDVVVEEFSSGDRPSRPPRPAKKVEEKEPSSSKTGLLIGLPLVLVLALGGGYFVLSGGGGTSSDGAGGGSTATAAATQTYQDYRTQADSLYYTANYDEARTFYNRALSERPDDAYATQRLNEITRRLNESTEARFEDRMQRGDELLARGDSLLEAGNPQDAARTLGRASAAFELAAELKPDDTTVDDKLAAVEERFSQIASAATSGEGGDGSAGATDSESLYALFREQGDELIEEGRYRSAARKFEEALEFKPGDDYAEEQLRRARNLRARQERLRTFGRNLQQALALLDEGKPEEAQPFLESARELYPNSGRLKEALARSEQMIAEREERQATYQRNRTAGDEAFAAERYADAARAYRDALDARPDDDYVAGRLEEARQRADEMQLANAAIERREQRRARMKEDEGTDVYTVVDEQPEVVGGLAGLHKRVRYPSRARSEGVQGRVFVEATVNADGTVRAAKVTRGIGGGCDEEALRVIRESTFEPAKVDGRPVAARKTLWIRFRLRGD
jgi:TonB family protein